MNIIPVELTEWPQWVLWRYEERDGKATKVPYQARTRLYRARTDDPRTWAAFDHAVEMSRQHGEHVSGIGFVFTEDDPYCGIDLDNCYPSDAAPCAPWAEGILERFSDTYGEESPSGKGIKIWCRAHAPRCGRWTVEDGAIEVYDRLRYFAVTGRSNRVLTVADHQHDVERLVGHLHQDRGTSPSHSTITGGAIPKGQRHPTLVSYGGTMLRRGMDLEAIEAALLVVNAKQCDPPYSPGHIRKIVESMRRWER